MRARPLPRTFRSGELAPWLDGITNELTQQGCRTAENFIIRKQGQAMRRPGTFFVNEVKNSANTTVLVPVTIDDDNSYVLELGDAYIRFYKNHARITHAGTTTIYEVVSPWSTGDVSDLRWTYIPDEKSLYFTHPSYAMRKLAWTSDASWLLTNVGIISSQYYLAIDESGTLLRSEDFVDWEVQKLSVLDARIAKGKSNYIIQTSLAFYVSGDAENWVKIDNSISLEKSLLGKTIVGAEHGQILAISGETTGTIHYSYDDGLTWTSTTGGSKVYRAIGFDPVQGMWLAAGPADGSTAYSDDGVSFTSVATAINFVVRALQGYDDLWVAVGTGGIATAPSVAGAWTVRVSITNLAIFRDVARSPSNLWVAVGSNTVTNSLLLYYSGSGTTWSEVSTPNFTLVDTRPRGLAWVHSRFVVHTSSKRGTYAESEDGQTWTSIPLVARLYDNISDSVIDDASEYEWFNTADHYPKNITYHEGRLVIGPTKNEPATLWASKTGKLRKFYLGEFANEAWSYGLASDRNVDIQWMMGNMGGLIVGTRTAEGIMLGSQEEGITPQTAQFRWLSTFGSANIQPVRSNNYVIFVQRGKEIVRGYVPQENAYESPELTFYADHIGKGGILSIDRQEDPQNILYFVRTDGQLPALSFEKQLVAWSRIKTASTSLSVGIIESIAVIPTTGAEDEVWQLVNRKVAAGTVRYIEYYDQLAVSSLADAHYVDCGVNPTSVVPFQTVGALTHLAGEVIDALIDGTRWVSSLTVEAAGTITVAPHSGTNIHAGLPYTSYLQTMRGDYGSPWGDGAGLNKRTSDLLVWVHDSTALAKFGPNIALATETIAYPSSTTLVTDVMKVNFPGQWDRDNYIWCIVTDPRPFTLVAMMPDSETGSR